MITAPSDYTRYRLQRVFPENTRLWLAYDRVFSCEVVIKLLDVGREAAVLDRLEGVPGVVKKLGWEAQVEVVFQGSAVVKQAIVLEYHPRGDLFSLVTSPTYDPNNEYVVRTLFLDIATALQEVHLRNIAHLDLKPENILLNSSGHALLADFEFAVIGNLQGITQNCGTPGYSAPEVGTGAYDGRAADVFSLGVLLYVLRLKSLPFRGVGDVVALRDHAEVYWAAKRRRNPTISPDFCRFFSRMVSFDPLLRPTISQILSDSWLQGPKSH